MKVVQINGVSSTGSTGKIVSQLSDVMNAQGIENYIISSGYKEHNRAGNVFFCSSYWEVKLHQLIGTILGDSGFHSRLATCRAIRFIKKVNPDIVQLHNIYSYFLNVEVLLKYLKRNNIPTVWTMHDFWSITGHCTHFEAVGCNKWQTQCENCPQKHTFPYSRFWDRSKELYGRKKRLFENWSGLQIVTVSSWVRVNAEKSYFKDKKITVISNGIDLNAFYPENVQKPSAIQGKFVILSVSMGWGEKKGYCDLLDLSKMLREDEVIVLIGLTDKQIAELPPNIIGLKRTANIAELRAYYNFSDVYISASVEETMGLTVAEAMACGTPAIVYNKTALPELIGEGCGYVCEKGASCLREKIDLVRESKKSDYSEKCITHVRKNYDKEKQYSRYCKLYEDVLRKQI